MLLRKGKNCNFIELANRDDLIVVYKRFAGNNNNDNNNINNTNTINNIDHNVMNENDCSLTVYSLLLFLLLLLLSIINYY